MTQKHGWRSLHKRLKDYISLSLSLSSNLEGRQAFYRWWKSAAGGRLASSQSRLFRRLATHLSSGHHFMLLGDSQLEKLSPVFDYTHFFSLGEGDYRPVQAKADSEELPLSSDVIDAVMLYHELEYADNPHRVLNEASRVLMPGGYMMIVVFNPLSAYGCYSLFRRLFTNNVLWQRHAIRKGRLLDWLKVLHLQPVMVGSAGYLLPESLVARVHCLPAVQRWLNRNTLPFGAYHIIVAKKIVAKPIDSGAKPWRLVATPKRAPKSLASNKLKRGHVVEKS